ncbi:hypothetical protein ACFQ3S_14750 [Mucilaginibacter terrae]|uniref:hypothetical protein n=1 Tax=Mucilaginibacter terrae TaxID=1955052 RepID=UPI003644B555
MFSKEFIQTILMFLITSAITLIGFKNEVEIVKWYKWNTTRTADWLMWLFAAALVITIWTFISNKKNAEIMYMSSPKFGELITNDNRLFTIPIYNGGQKVAKDVSCHIEAWSYHKLNDLKLLEIWESSLLNIQDNTTTLHRKTISEKYLQELGNTNGTLVLYIEVKYNDGEAFKTATEIFTWNRISKYDLMFLRTIDKNLYSNVLTEILKRKSR